ncbi:uncharacterized protein LOC127258332 [Andrographis paniculata]|uniref:uncharacterized protein LOC127258332 n=1 Tax=Andrographis paniculata TaxID=175694 RepID=UPI0021E712D9|nr:uncharacterized protein LOC127258332 [Andrographis paniculata]
MRRLRCAVKSSSSENYDPVMHRVMMLRFRPIAPKPADGEAVSAALKVVGARRKRKYVRVRGRKNTNMRSNGVKKPSPPLKSGVEDDSSLEKGVETLQLMLERSESDKSYGNSTTVQKIHQNIWNIGGGDEAILPVNGGCDAAAESAATGNSGSVMGTWIVVECVTDTFLDSGVGLGLSDRDKINSLKVDTCPGFISDGAQKVVWINEAYRNMVAEENRNGTMVRLSVRDELIPQNSPSFSCRVRMSQQTKQGYKWNRILACDVWRMKEFAGFAWRLDLNTALGLAI